MDNLVPWRRSLRIEGTVHADLAALCKLDVLRLKDPPTYDEGTVHSEFKEQLRHSPEGWYETGLPWKGDMPFLPNNNAGSLRCLNSLVRELARLGMIEKYDNVI